MNSDVIKTIEKHLNDNRNILQDLKCSHKEIYGKQEHFKFLPGHSVFLLSLPNMFSMESRTKAIEEEGKWMNPAFSGVLSEMVQSAIVKTKFTKTLMDFSMYQYLMGGRACYKVLAANLPIPKVGTIREN